MKRLGILLSGRGSNFAAIADAIAQGALTAEIALVVSNRQDAPGLAIAQQRGLPMACIPSRGVGRMEHDLLVLAALQEARVDLVCLAGYLRLLTPDFVQAYRGRMLNVHPSLLPAFPGLHAQRQALEYGVKIAGCTVHFVTEEMDAGPIVMQSAVPVEPSDTEETLSARILAEEHRIYPLAIQRVLAGLA